MATVASLQFGQQLMTALVPTLKGSLAIGATTQAVLSPLSIWFALVLLLNGAGLPSSTYNELWQVVTGSPPGNAAASAADLAALNGQAAALRTALARQATVGNSLVMADGVWTKGIKVNPEYASSMKALFKAEATSVPNATPINQWAERVTNGLIPQVVSPSLNFNMVLTNALYFKGVWEYPFEKRRTQAQAFAAVTKESTAKGCSGTFRTSCTEEVQVPMMRRVFEPTEMRGTQSVALASAPGQYHAVRLPYKGSAGMAAVFVLPDAGAYDSIMDAAREVTGAMVLDPKAWQELDEPVSVALPRLKVEVKQLGLKEILNKLGIRAAFGQADFSKASADPLVLTNVLHSAIVHVDEFGTEAAAATAAVTLKSALDPKPPKSLVFNRPFLFFLVETTTKTVLFQGAVADPRGSY